MNILFRKLRAFARYLPLILSITSVICAASLVYMFCVGLKPVGNDTQKVREGTVLAETPDGGQGYISGLIFIADRALSPIRETDGLIKPEQIWTGTDGHFNLDKNCAKYATIVFPETGEELTISQALERKKPQFIVLSIGADNGTACTEENFKAYYTSLIKQIRVCSPETQIILQSILPVTRSYEKSSTTISQKKINKCNTWITEIASQNRLKYADTASALSGFGGYLNSSYDSRNGLSVNSSGYEKIILYLRTHVYMQ